jgi:phenylpropionate dioxygenase-like ring-hydroxylating dioxygenase large terminal subunit
MTTFASNPALAGYWYPVAIGSSLGASPLAFELLGRPIVVWRAGEALTAMADRCPHREAPLSMGVIEDGCIVCPYHGWTFSPDGTCVGIPSQRAQLPAPRNARVESLNVVERYGLVWVCPGQPVAGIVDVPEDLDPAYRRLNCSFEVWNASASRLMDNFVDYSHFPFTHGPSFGSVTDALVPSIVIDSRSGISSYTFEVRAANPESARPTTRVDLDTVTRTMTHAYAMPFTVRNVIAYESGLRHVVLIQLTPLDDDRTLFTMTIFRNDDHTISPYDVLGLDRQVVAEDRRMMEAIPGTLPLDPRRLSHVQADRPAVDWARRFAALLDGVPS